MDLVSSDFTSFTHYTKNASVDFLEFLCSVVSPMINDIFFSSWSTNPNLTNLLHLFLLFFWTGHQDDIE